MTTVRARAVAPALLLAWVLAACSGGGGGEQGAPPVTPPASPPLPQSPVIGNTEYVIDPVQWKISTDGTNAAATTDGINAAIQKAKRTGYDRVKLPAGTYLIGKRDYDLYVSGIQLESSMALVMEDGAVLQMIDGDTLASCIVEVTGQHDVAILGGEIRGDRNTHTYRTSSPDDENHAICIQNESERVWVEGVTIHQATGDGIIVLAQGAAGSSCKDVTITQNEIYDNRRQGVSIVGGERVRIEDNRIHHMKGTAPQFGIDIESQSYTSRDIIIRGNSFHHNHGGDYVNFDGRDVLFAYNTLDQGEGETQIDGPVVYWKNTDQTILGNTITVRNGSVNGKIGIIGYSNDSVRTDTRTNYVTENLLIGGGMYMHHTGQLQILRNQLDGGFIALSDLKDLVLSGNTVQQSSPSWAYRFRRCYGSADANLLNGKDYEIPLSSDAPFTNYSDW